MSTTQRGTPYAFPLVLPSDPIKRWTGCTIGRFVLTLRPALERSFLDGHQPEGRWERFALQAVVDRYERQGNTSGISTLQQHYWTTGNIVAYHEQVEQRFETVFKGAHYGIVDHLLDAAHGIQSTTFCEIGCGSGLVIAHFAERTQQIPRFIGVDLSPEQVAVNEQRYRDPRISFVGADAIAWIQERNTAGWTFLSYGGVLEYIPQERLRGFLRALASKAPAAFGIVEPIAEGFDPEQATESIRFGAERSLSHPYVRMFTEAGFQVTWKQEVRVEGMRFLMLVARSA